MVRQLHFYSNGSRLHFTKGDAMDAATQFALVREGEVTHAQSLSSWSFIVVPDTESAIMVVEHLEAIKAKDMKVEHFDGRYRIRWR